MKFVIFIDENDFNKKQRALRRYFMKCYKYLIFQLMPKLKQSGKKDGRYEVELPIDELFTKVYGKMVIQFTVKDDVAIIEDIQPSEILLACYEKDLPTYKGIPYDKQSDLTKLKIMEEMLK